MVRTKGLVIWLSVLSGLQGFTAAGAFADVVGPKLAALALAVTAAATTGTATFLAASRGEIPVTVAPPSLAK